ncbi:transmembrane protein [Perilla frutescens var. hirtella]|uniref:Transmembrane protein n=1 Tax=Perilla frutescens var. hirtella TaxID=608512 RepID=A0AAD4IXX4_PERFH|nr:transmembrane protein [Perilla frutescens var. hirtella]
MKKRDIWSSKLVSVYLIAMFVVFLVVWQIQSLQTSSTSPWETFVTEESASMATKLRESVTFLPLKDLRYAGVPMKGHTWFMSSLYDMHEQGEVQYQEFPTEATGGRVLCLRGHNRHDGLWNSYALAWPDTLPHNATLMRGITFVSYNHYDYHNIWHGLSAMMSFVAWHIKRQCGVPERWILYHWGEVRSSMAPWVTTLLAATFGVPVKIEDFERLDDDIPACFERAVVMRHNEGGMSTERRMEVYDLMRCRSRMFCEVGSGRDEGLKIGMTMLMRDGARSFKNASAVIGIFEEECRRVEGCRLMVAYPHNLSFCEQVKLMSSTDIVISAHGAQLSNMILMDRNSSVMELFPKGWKELAGVGQYVYHWLASWSGMKHEGAWRDPHGAPCPYPDHDRRCMSVFKNGLIGHNHTYFSEWARNVIKDLIWRKAHQDSYNPVSGLCGCP